MADKATETGKTNFRRKTNGEFISDENARQSGDVAGLDEELKSLFDNLRAIGNPRDYSLDEALVKAISLEKDAATAAAGNKAKISGTETSRGVKSGVGQIFKIREADLQFQVMSMLTLILVSICILFVLPLTGEKKDLKVTEQFRQIQMQVKGVL